MCLRLLYEELAAVPGEFDHVTLDLRRSEIAVTTAHIVLEDVDLGPLEIRLDGNNLGDSQPYRVVALEARSAASDGETTHPHIQCEQLCEGDARLPLRAALTGGRLSDVFLIVTQTLQTYHAGSAYIELDQWEGLSCTDCDDTIDPEDVDYCERCSRLTCGDCSRFCEDCGHAYCNGCTDRCAACEDSFCTSCLHPCDSCEASHCDHCLTGGRCDACQPDPQPEGTFHDDSDSIAPRTMAAAAASPPPQMPAATETPSDPLHPNRLGQTAASA